MTRFDEARIDRAFASARRLVDDGTYPCAVFAVALGDGPARVQAFSGLDTVECDSVFPLASISKVIVATALLQLAQVGELELARPVQRYLPTFSSADITTWHLLTHTSGLAADMSWPETLRERPTAETLLSRACEAKPVVLPGSRWSYNTLGFFALGALLDHLTGLRHPAALRQNLLAPLGMPDTGYDPSAANGRAVLLDDASDGDIDRSEWTRYQGTLAAPGFGLWSSAADMIRFGQTMLSDVADGTAQVLAPAWAEVMTRDHTATIPRLGEEGAPPARYGLGWRKGTLDGRPTLPGSSGVFEHDGATGCHLWIDPQWGLVSVFLTNRYNVEGWPYVRPLQAVYGALRHGCWRIT